MTAAFRWRRIRCFRHGPRDTKTAKLVYGYSAGVGMDIMLVGGLFPRAEYEYQRVTSTIESNINTVRLGIGYKF